ncbi:MAG: hypothetical protein Q9190_006384 [Brigantiaea leucoxantha]
MASGLMDLSRQTLVVVSLDHFQASEDCGQTVCCPLSSIFRPSIDAVLHLSISTVTWEAHFNPIAMDTIYSFDYYTESWIEVSSQPSSPSLSSAGADEAPTAGSHLQHGRRRRRLNTNSFLSYPTPRSTSATGSSQEEYEESESESDRLMTSSHEGLDRRYSEDVNPQAPASASDEAQSGNDDDDDDENSTAVGMISNEPVFTPQPNAFSHPPQGSTVRQIQSAETRTSYYRSQRATSHRPAARSYPAQRARTHTPYNVISPSYQADHDAALRASLSTLLSCAAAARGLPKREPSSQPIVRPSNQIETSTLRMVPESVVLGEEATRPRPITRRTISTDSSSGLSIHDKGKRKASTSRERREKRKKRRGSIEDMGVSPTLLTWVMSAGVVVLFSAISFSAGYAMGKEVGRIEAGMGAGGNGTLSGREVGKGLRKLRLGTPTIRV